jgi:hypothetical protein
MLSFAYKRFDGGCRSLASLMPRTGRCWPESRRASRLSVSCTTPASSAPLLRYLRTCLGEAMGLAREANGYTFATLPSYPQDRQCMPGPQGAVVPDQGGPPGRGDERIHHPARRRQSETILAPTLRVPHTAQKLHEYLGYEGQLRCLCTGHAAGGRVPGGDAEPRGADL